MRVILLFLYFEIIKVYNISWIIGSLSVFFNVYVYLVYLFLKMIPGKFGI